MTTIKQLATRYRSQRLALVFHFHRANCRRDMCETWGMFENSKLFQPHGTYPRGKAWQKIWDREYANQIGAGWPTPTPSPCGVIHNV